MGYHICTLSELPHKKVDVAVVIDVFRATTTAVVLAARTSENLLLLREPSDLAELPGPASDYLVFSELHTVPKGFEQVDNSPVTAAKVDTIGRTPVLITTNGTKTVATALDHASEVLLASFVNLTAVADYLRAKRNDTEIAIVPSGSIVRNEPRFEDDQCAYALAQVLAGAEVDIAASAAMCWKDQHLIERLGREENLTADIRMCLDVNRYEVVPRVGKRDGTVIYVQPDANWD